MPKRGKSAESCGHRHHCDNDTFTNWRKGDDNHWGVKNNFMESVGAIDGGNERLNAEKVNSEARGIGLPRPSSLAQLP